MTRWAIGSFECNKLSADIVYWNRPPVEGRRSRATSRIPRQSSQSQTLPLRTHIQRRLGVDDGLAALLWTPTRFGAAAAAAAAAAANNNTSINPCSRPCGILNRMTWNVRCNSITLSFFDADNSDERRKDQATWRLLTMPPVSVESRRTNVLMPIRRLFILIIVPFHRQECGLLKGAHAKTMVDAIFKDLRHCEQPRSASDSDDLTSFEPVVQWTNKPIWLGTQLHPLKPSRRINDQKLSRTLLFILLECNVT
jgi:hypothetical protein